jgi:hypothetical protein
MKKREKRKKKMKTAPLKIEELYMKNEKCKFNEEIIKNENNTLLNRNKEGEINENILKKVENG